MNVFKKKNCEYQMYKKLLKFNEPSRAFVICLDIKKTLQAKRKK